MDYISSVLLVVFLVFLLLFNLDRKRKVRNTNVMSFVLVVYVIGSFASIIYYFVDFAGYIQNVKIVNYIYWFVIFFITCYPIYKFDGSFIKGYKYNIKFLRIVCVISLLLGIVPLLEQLSQVSLVFSSNDVASTVSEIHDDNDKSLHFSYISELCLRVLNYTYYIVLVSIVPILRNLRKNIWALCGIIASFATRLMPAILLSSRPLFASAIIELVLVFLLFYPLLYEHEKKVILKYGGALFLSIGGVLVALTIFRQVGDSAYRGEAFTMSYFLSRYLGEGLTNFAQYASDIKMYFYGDQCFYFLKKIFGIQQYEMTRDLAYSLESKTGYPMNVFYTYIGAFVQDIGMIGTFVFLSIVAFFVTRIISGKEYLRLSSLYLFFIYSEIIIYGVTFYKYQFTSSQNWIALTLGYIVLRANKC